MRLSLLLVCSATVLSSGCYDEQLSSLDNEVDRIRAGSERSASELSTRITELEATNQQLREVLEQRADLQPRVAELERSLAEADSVHDALDARLTEMAWIADQEAEIADLREEVLRLEAAAALEHNGSAQLAALGGLLTLSPLIPLWASRRRQPA
jgi:chromosome segregation ATPase